MDIATGIAPRVVLAPAPEVYFAQYEREVVVLDLERDAYLSLGPAVSDAVLWALDSANHAEPAGSAELLAPLCERGLLIAAPAGSAGMSALAPTEPGGLVDQSWSPHHSMLLNQDVTADTRQIASALGWIARAHRALRRGSSMGLVRWMRRQAEVVPVARRPDSPTAGLGALVAASITARMIYPRQIECLVGSAALAAHAWSRQIDVQVVFGVQKYPFHAHAWVQYGETVVNDGPEPVRRLAPILTVEASTAANR